MADNFFPLKFITSSVADNAKFQYNQLMPKEVVINKENSWNSILKLIDLTTFSISFLLLMPII